MIGRYAEISYHPCTKQLKNVKGKGAQQLWLTILENRMSFRKS